MKFVKTMKYSEMMEWLRNNKIIYIQYIYCLCVMSECFKSVEDFKNFLENKFDKRWLKKVSKYCVYYYNDSECIILDKNYLDNLAIDLKKIKFC